MWHRTSTHVWNQAVLFCNRFTRLVYPLQHTCLLNLLLNKRHMCYSCTWPPGMSVTVALSQHAFLLELHLTSRYFWISCNWLASISVVVGAEPVGISVTLASDPAVMSLCSYPTNKLVSTIAPDNQSCVLQLHLTSSHVLIISLLSACMSVTVSSYQHPCILTLHQTINHICNNCTRPFVMPFTVAPN